MVPDANEVIRLTAEEKEQTLFVVPRLNPAFLDVCRKHRVSVVDLNGRTFIRAPGVWIERGPLPGREYRFELEPRNVFVGKSVRIVRTLLTDPQRLWAQSEITRRTGASSGLVSRITTHLLRQGLLRKVDARRFHVVSPSLLLDAWVNSDEFGRRAATQRYSALISDPVQLAKKLRNDLTHAPDAPLFAFTQWIAAWLRHPYTEPPIVSAYISRLPAPEQLERLGLRPVNEAGRVWLHVPTDEGVFLERRTVENLPLVTDAQIYLDLVKTGLRGPEQAQALREWDGFCRP
ncbi:MAG: hypothetical protein JNK23_04745 [Opitutaceae bacterium]|nr:hypothetical protein [Opitutaceae bacterium]